MQSSCCAKESGHSRNWKKAGVAVGQEMRLVRQAPARLFGTSGPSMWEEAYSNGRLEREAGGRS